MGRAKHRKLRRAVCRMAGRVGADLGIYRSQEMPLQAVLVLLYAKEIARRVARQGFAFSVGERVEDREEVVKLTPPPPALFIDTELFDLTRKG